MTHRSAIATQSIARWWETDASLLAYYPFGSSNSWNDQSGNGLNLTATGGATINATGAVRSAQFNGSTGYAQTSAAVPNGTSYTVMMWLWFDSLASDSIWIGQDRSSTDDSKAEWQLLVGYPSRDVGFYIATTDLTYYGVTLFSSPATGTWYQIAATIDNTAKTVTVFVNGSPVGTPASFAGQTPLTNSTRLFFGRQQWAAAKWFAGRINDLAIVDRAAASAEIAAYYNATRSYYA